MDKKYLCDLENCMCYEVGINESGQLSSFKVIGGSGSFNFIAENIETYESYNSLEELKKARPEYFI